MEARESNAELKALSLVSEFVKKFRFIDFTVHPGGSKQRRPTRAHDRSVIHPAAGNR